MGMIIFQSKIQQKQKTTFPKCPWTWIKFHKKKSNYYLRNIFILKKVFQIISIPRE